MNNIVRKTVSLASLLVFALTAFTIASVSAQAQTTAGFGSNDNGRTLEDFFTASLEYSPRLQIAEDRMRIGEARRRGATGQLLPQASATASVSDNRQDQTGLDVVTYRGERYALQLRQVLFDWQAFNRRRQAAATENQYEAEYYDELATVFAIVAEAYFNVLQAEDALASNHSELNAIRQQEEQVQRLYALRTVQVTDVYDVQARVAALEAEQVNLEAEVSLARETLRSETGLSAGQLYVLNEDSVMPPLEGNLESWVEQARLSSHRINAREFAVEAADRRVSESRGAYMPRVSLIMQQQRSNLGFDNMPMRRTDTGYVGIDLTMPLYAGGSNRAAVREATSMHSIAQSELRQIQLEVIDRVRMLYLRMQANAQRIEAAEKMVESLTLSATSRQRGFELGNITSADLLDALHNQFRAERDLQTLRYEHIKLGLFLRQAAGTLSAEDMLDVSSWLQPATVTPTNN
jgi:outer membrane protein